MISVQKIKPFLWYDGAAEEAANYYVAAFPGSAVTHVMRYGKEGPGPEGQVMLVEFTLAGQVFAALNGGPQFTPNESVSLAITCEDQAEVDRLWAYLSDGGSPSVCGWLKDRWGYSWQVVPRRFFEMMADPDKARTGRVFAAMMAMTKFDIAALERAYAGN